MTRKYYIVHKSNWQGDSWRPIAGPFGCRKEAEVHPAAAGYHPHQDIGGIDIKSEINAMIVSRTWLIKHGYPRGVESDTDILESIWDFKTNPIFDLQRASYTEKSP